MTREQLLNARLHDLRELLVDQYSYDVSLHHVKLTDLAASKVGRYSPSKSKLTLSKESTRLIELDLVDLYDDNQHPFIDFLSYRDEIMWPIGSVLRLDRLEIASDLQDFEVAALSHLTTLFLMVLAECVVVEEAEMLRQSTVLQEKWKEMYGFWSEKEIEYQGIRYWRFDDPASMMH